MKGLNGLKFKNCVLSVDLRLPSSQKPSPDHSKHSRVVPALPLRGALLKDITSGSGVTSEENVLQMSNVAAADMVAQILSHAPMYVSPFNSPRVQDARGPPPRLNLRPITESAGGHVAELPAQGNTGIAVENTVLWETASDVQSSISDSFASTLDTEDSRFADTQQRNWMRRGVESSSPAVLWAPGASDPLGGPNSVQYSGAAGANLMGGGQISTSWNDWSGAPGAIGSNAGMLGMKTSVPPIVPPSGAQGEGVFFNKADATFDSFLSVDPDFLSTPRLLASAAYTATAALPEPSRAPAELPFDISNKSRPSESRFLKHLSHSKDDAA